MSKEKTSTFYLKKLCQKLTDFNDFWHVKFGKNLTWNVTDLSTSPVRCSHFTLGNPKKSFSAVFMHNCDYLCYLRRKKNCNPLAHSPENITTLTCELQNFFISLKVCCVLSNVGCCEESQWWVVVGGSETGCDVWQLECLASNVTASIQTDHLLR